MPQPPLPQRRVFIVDDEYVIATTLAMILRREGFDVTPFTEPLVALESARAAAPDLLVSDVLMPVLSGIELAIHLRALSPACKVLLFSGTATIENLLKSAHAEGHDFELLLKPVHPLTLLARIRDLLEGATPPVRIAAP